MQQHNRSHLPSFCRQVNCCLFHFLQLQRPNFISFSIQSPHHFNHLCMQRLGLVDIQYKKFRPALVSNAQEIPKAIGHKEDHLRPFLLQKRISASRGTKAHLSRWQLLVF